MEQALEDVLDGLARVNVVVAPRLGDALNGKLDDELGDLAGRLVEEHSEVVLGEEGVGGVGRVGVVPHLELVVGVGVEDSLGRVGERLGGRAEEGLDVGLNGGHDEHRHRVANLLSKGTQARDSIDRVLDALHDLVAEAENLPEDLVELLGAHGARVLSRGAEVLEVVHLATEVVRVLARHLDKHLAEVGSGSTLASLDVARVGERLAEVGHSRRRQVVTRLTHERVDKVGTAEGAGNKREDLLALGRADAAVLADVREDLVVAHRDESELTEVGVSGEVLESVEGSAEETESLVLVGLVAVVVAATANLNALEKSAADKRLGRVPVAVLCVLVMSLVSALAIRDVVLHARSRVDFQFTRIDRATKAGVVTARILSFGVTLRVVDVLSREVAAEALLGDLELLGGVAVS